MKYVTGQNEDIRVIELPDDARPITAEDETVLAAREQALHAKEQKYLSCIALAEEKRAMQTRIGELKRLLNNSDYQAIKFAEGEMSEDEFAHIRAERVAWRKEINKLEEELCNMS